MENWLVGRLGDVHSGELVETVRRLGEDSVRRTHLVSWVGEGAESFLLDGCFWEAVAAVSDGLNLDLYIDHRIHTLRRAPDPEIERLIELWCPELGLDLVMEDLVEAMEELTVVLTEAKPGAGPLRIRLGRYSSSGQFPLHLPAELVARLAALRVDVYG